MVAYFPGMAAWFRKALNIHPGEGQRVALMSVYIFLLIATLLVIKPVRTSLFLTVVGVEALPYVFILVAVGSALLVALYAKVSSRMRLDRLIGWTMTISIVSLLGFWLLLRSGYEQPWFFYLFWVWVAIFGVLVTSQFWLMANYVFDAREAKRLFGLLGAGAITGGIFGGYITQLVTSLVGTEHVLLLGVGYLVLAWGLVRLIWSSSARDQYTEQLRRRRRVRSRQAKQNTLQLIFASRHLTYWMLLIGIAVVVANLVDYQYNAVASGLIEDQDQLTEFFGFWLSTFNVVSLLIQVFLTGRVIKNFGVATSLYFLPVGVLLGAVAVLGSGALWSAVLIKLSDGSLKQSIHKAGVELLALPVPANIKNRVKAFIDIFVDSFATGLGGLLLILLTGVLGLGIPAISMLIVALVLVWLFVNVQVRREYVRAFRRAIEKRTIQLHEETVAVEDAGVLEGLLRVLDGDNERQILYVLSLIEHTRSDRLTPYLANLLDKDGEEVLVRTLSLARRQKKMDLGEKVERLCSHPNQQVRIEAVRYRILAADDVEAMYQRYVNDDDLRTRLAALMVAAMSMDQVIAENAQSQVRESFRRVHHDVEQRHLSGEELSFFKVEFSRILGTANDPELYPYLHLLLGDTSLRVLRQAVSAAGQTRSEEFVPTLTAHLSTKRVRSYAQEALANHGDAVVRPLLERLDSPREDRRIRMAIPDVLQRIATQAAVDALQQYMDTPSIALRDAVVRALSKIRDRYEALEFHTKLVEKRILAEAREYSRKTVLRSALRNALAVPEAGKERVALDLLLRALDEKRAKTLERIFRLLSLRYDPDDMYNAYLGVTNEKADLRANALEFLDNVLDYRFKRVILPLAERSNPLEELEKAQELYGFMVPNEEECLRELVNGEDSWLRTCALFRLKELGATQLASVAEERFRDHDPMVRETAKLAFRSLK